MGPVGGAVLSWRSMSLSRTSGGVSVGQVVGQSGAGHLIGAILWDSVELSFQTCFFINEYKIFCSISFFNSKMKNEETGLLHHLC